MTTIAFDGKTLAVDRASWKNGYVWTEVEKLHLLKPSRWAMAEWGFKLDEQDAIDQIAIAFAGSAADVPLIRKWIRLADSSMPEPPKLREPDIQRGLVLVGDRVYGLTGICTLEPYASTIVADGGGFEVALGAMLAGADAVRAIRITAQRASWAAAGISSFTIGQTEIQRHRIEP